MTERDKACDKTRYDIDEYECADKWIIPVYLAVFVE